MACTITKANLRCEYHEYYDVYFDKKTGMAVGLRMEQVNSDDELLNGLTLTIKESNVWTVPEFPSTIAISILMITVSAGSIIYKKLVRFKSYPPALHC